MRRPMRLEFAMRAYREAEGEEDRCPCRAALRFIDDISPNSLPSNASTCKLESIEVTKEDFTGSTRSEVDGNRAPCLRTTG